MDKTFLVFIAIGIGFFYFVTGFVGDIQERDDKFQNTEYQKEHQFDEYITTDSIGQMILDVTLADPKTQIDAWNQSVLKQEFLDLFPDFDTMRMFVKDRVRGDHLIRQLNHKIDTIEDKFFSGAFNAEQAKRALKRL